MKSSHLSFYIGGELRKFNPEAEVVIDGIACSHEHGVELYPDGRLLCCHLAGDIRERDRDFLMGSRILKDEQGNIHPYSFPVHIAITRLLNIKEHFSEPLLYAYHKRMEGQVDSVRNIFNSDRNDRNPMIHYEAARIIRHRMVGKADVNPRRYLYFASRSFMHRYNVITGFFHAESMLFIERNKQNLEEDLRDNNYYDQAIMRFESVLELKPDYHAARLHLVDIYKNIPENLGGDPERAKMHARELLKYDTVWSARAEAILLPDHEEMLDFWIGYRKNHESNPMMWQELGRACLAEDDVQNAECCFRKAMELDRDKCILLADLARYHIKGLQRDRLRAAEHIAAAEDFLMEYIRTDPVNPHKAWCYAKLSWLKDLAGKEEEGAQLLEMARQSDMRFSREEAPPSMLLFIPLGEVYREFDSYFNQ
jgi:tetratricopeptide (TPR) repeat protein